ncbi:protoporphyrinogen oxidase [Cryptococcus amylolentus CBS 6039]|uniref:Protoporphyrinogen oxidase n=1 Tax=Cryptococcus amylolentus CBS 6039 TaxID=1295533 RepID=A0A1E3HP57_9TREE|nr:protoporphyrinogen oxidase [Cryptococcus amylolentus CBS 6039]ODN77496.1 protoporphyrinogen oxidase [Cryptococcus amylolentus CBS 6039]
MPPPPKNITILGAGLSGLSTAYHLSTHLPASSGTKITVLEAANHIGGWVDSRKYEVGFKGQDGVIREGVVGIETGPRSIRPRGGRGAATMLRMLRDIGLEESIISIPFSHPAAKNRFLLDTSTFTLTPLPSSLPSVLRPQPPLLKGLLPLALSEPLRSRGKEKELTADGDESVDSFFRRRFGDSIADNLASAMVHGIYATSSKQLSLRSAFPILHDAEAKYGSVVAGMLLGTKSKAARKVEADDWAELGELGKRREEWSLYGIKGGLGAITEKLLERVTQRGVRVVNGEPVRHIELSRNPEEPISLSTSARSFKSSHLISALPPRLLSHLLPSSAPLPHLAHNPSTCVGVINIVLPLPPSQVHPAGFGYLVPRSSPEKNPSGVLGVIFDSTAVPPSPPELDGQITKLTVMLGGPYWSSYTPNSPTHSEPETLIPLALSHLRKTFPHLANVEPVLAVGNIHHNCIPTYLPGHGQRLRELHENIGSGEWKGKISLVGNGYGGVGVNDCVYSGWEVATALGGGDRVTGLERWHDWE